MMTRREADNILSKTFIFSNFSQAMKRMQQVALECERVNHHPTQTNTYNTVFVQLTTHDEGNTITEKDYQIANFMDKIME